MLHNIKLFRFPTWVYRDKLGDSIGEKNINDCLASSVHFNLTSGQSFMFFSQAKAVNKDEQGTHAHQLRQPACPVGRACTQFSEALASARLQQKNN